MIKKPKMARGQEILLESAAASIDRAKPAARKTPTCRMPHARITAPPAAASHPQNRLDDLTVAALANANAAAIIAAMNAVSARAWRNKSQNSTFTITSAVTKIAPRRS